MRSFSALALGTIMLAACTLLPSSDEAVTTSTLASADAATSLLIGDTLTLASSTQAPAQEGMDPVVTLTLRHADGRTLRFREANHTPDDTLAQAPGGALAQIMGLFGEERPVLYHALPFDLTAAPAPFLCAEQGPAGLGLYDDGLGGVQIVALRQLIQFEDRPDGVREALPFSPDQVCARLRLRRDG